MGFALGNMFGKVQGSISVQRLFVSLTKCSLLSSVHTAHLSFRRCDHQQHKKTAHLQSLVPVAMPTRSFLQDWDSPLHTEFLPRCGRGQKAAACPPGKMLPGMAGQWVGTEAWPGLNSNIPEGVSPLRSS